MKNLLKTLLLLFCFISLSHLSQAQSETTKKNLFKVNLLSPLVRTSSFSYERTLSTSSSVVVGLFYTNIPKEFYGFGLTPAYRFYLSNTKQAPVGFYVSPYGRLCYFNSNRSSLGFTAVTAGLGIELGYQWVFKDVVSLNVFGGIGYSTGGISSTSYDSGDVIDSFIIGIDTSRLLGLSLGVAF